MAKKAEVTIVPGVVGLAAFLSERWVEQTVEAVLDVRYDRNHRRYVLHELRLVRHDPTSAGVTAEALRYVKVDQYLALSILAGAQVRTLPNPDGREPWGTQLPDRLGLEGPTDRVLRWVAHVYRYAVAVHVGPTQTVEGWFGVSRATAGRWVGLARKQGFLEPAEGPGKVGG
jgi:hypothetical protein